MKHELVVTERAYTCQRCGRSWGQSPSSDSCPGIRWYAWQSSPEYLKTYTQLRAKHLRPRDRRKPDGCIVCKDEWVSLYDEREALPRRTCTERQYQALAVARQRQREKWTCEHCGYAPSSLAALCHHFAWPGLCLDCKERIEEESRLYGDRLEAIEWARAILECSDCCILDTETTSLTGYVLELAIVALDGTVLFHSLINPEHEVTPGARAVHGITDEELAAAPRLPDLWPQIQEALVGHSLILSYGVDFDDAVMHRSARRYQLPELTQKWDCLKEWYAQYYGEWSDYWGNYKWQSLDGGHRALADAQAALRLLKMMAATKLDEGSE